MNEEFLEVLEGIKDKMDKIDDIVYELDRQNKNLKTIADALVFITGVLDKRL